MRIRLVSCSPPIGEAGPADGASAQRFVGWLDLLRVLATLIDEQTEVDPGGGP